MTEIIKFASTIFREYATVGQNLRHLMLIFCDKHCEIRFDLNDQCRLRQYCEGHKNSHLVHQDLAQGILCLQKIFVQVSSYKSTELLTSFRQSCNS